MRVPFNIFVRVTIIVMVAILSVSWAGTSDSLQVKIIDTPNVGDFRFIVRDSSHLILRVMDKEGYAFKELTPAQIRINRGEENARILEVSPLKATIEASLNVVLALDNSSSMQGSVKELLASTDLLLESLRNRSRISVVLFDEGKTGGRKNTGRIDNQDVNIKFLKFTADLDSTSKYIHWNYKSDNLSNKTYLNDLILVSLQQFEKLRKNTLRIIVLLSDGEDLGSKFDLERALEEARKSGVTIYGIDFNAQANQTLKEISQVTPSGKVFRARKATDLMPVFDAISQEIITEFRVTYHFPIPPTGTVQFAGDSLLISGRKLVDEFPMLNYVFFDSASAEIKSSYRLFASAEMASNFNETTIARPLEKYYQILNVIGQRVYLDTLATLTITGCNMNAGSEKGNLALSRARAEVVSRYFQEIWGIDSARIHIQARNLPEKSSSITTPEGQAENRRVEIFSQSFEILRPIRSEIIEYIYRPEIGQFNTALQAPEGLREWQFLAFHEDMQLAKMVYNMPKTQVTWNWIAGKGEKILEIPYIHYRMVVRDKENQVFESPVQTLPIAQPPIMDNSIEARQDSLFEKFGLVLFDFNSSQLSGNNKNLLNKILARYQEHPEAVIRVYGFSDAIGSEDYNKKLSTERAKMTFQLLARMGIPKDRISFYGYGEINPLFSNDTPEGRYLNRTVQIYIGYPSSQI